MARCQLILAFTMALTSCLTESPVTSRPLELEPADVATLRIIDFSFVPRSIRTNSEAQTPDFFVEVINRGSHLHNFSLVELKIDVDLNSGNTLSQGIVFPRPGSFAFVCKYHRATGMQGTITVPETAEN
jgi:hypothetical protein